MVGSAPRQASGRHRAAHRLEQRLGVAPGDRHHRDLEDGLRLGDRQLLAAGLGAPAGRERIAGVDRHVHHAAALHAVLRAVRSDREHVALVEAVVLRIRIDQAADGAVLPRHLGLDAAPAAAVAGQHDLPLHADAGLLELLVVGRHAEVHVDDLAGDLAVGGIGVVGRRLVLVERIGILRDRRLLDQHGPAGRLHHLEPALARPRHVGLGHLDGGVEAERLELLQRVLGDHLRTRAPGDVGLGRHRLHVLAQPGGVGHGAEPFLERPLGGRPHP